MVGSAPWGPFSGRLIGAWLLGETVGGPIGATDWALCGAFITLGSPSSLVVVFNSIRFPNGKSKAVKEHQAGSRKVQAVVGVY